MQNLALSGMAAVGWHMGLIGQGGREAWGVS
jgi:hypothetical protein